MCNLTVLWLSVHCDIAMRHQPLLCYWCLSWNSQQVMVFITKWHMQHQGCILALQVVQLHVIEILQAFGITPTYTMKLLSLQQTRPTVR